MKHRKISEPIAIYNRQIFLDDGHQNQIRVLASAAHTLKLERYRED